MLHRRELDYCPPAPHPPPSRLGFVELLIRLRRNPLECWSVDLFHEPVAKLRLPFTDAFLVHHPQAIKRVLMDNSKNYQKDTIQRRILSSGLSDGLLSVEGERWEVQRRTLAPIFARRTVTSFTKAMVAAANELAARWTSLGPEAEIDVADEMALVTLNVLALTIFSDGIGGDYDEFRGAMNAYFGVVGRIGVMDLFGVPKFVPRPGHRRLHRTLAYFEEVIDTIISARDQRLATSAETHEPDDLLTLLLRSLDPSTGRQLSPTEVRSNILTFLSAGHETTANTLAWSIFLLSQVPEWRLRVVEEAERELSNPKDDLADRLIVTKAVIEELRLYPPIAALSRAAVEADVLGDMAVKPRSLIVIAPYVLHRHRGLWSRPDAFDPSRFLPEARAQFHVLPIYPSGLGLAPVSVRRLPCRRPQSYLPS